MTTHVLTPTQHKTTKHFWPKLFLAGSIEQGKATDWQQKAIDFYSAQQELQDLVITNPRRSDWDASWVQSIENREFNFQVTFELDNLEDADAVIMWLEPGTLSPISLFEFGLMAGWTSAGLMNKLVIGCPPGFWRRGNVEVVTNRYRITLVDDFDVLLREGYDTLRRNYARRCTFTNEYGLGIR